MAQNMVRLRTSIYKDPVLFPLNQPNEILGARIVSGLSRKKVGISGDMLQGDQHPSHFISS